MTTTLSKQSFCAKCHGEMAGIAEWQTLEWKQSKLNVSKAANHIVDLLGECTRQPAQCQSHYVM